MLFLSYYTAISSSTYTYLKIINLCIFIHQWGWLKLKNTQIPFFCRLQRFIYIIFLLSFGYIMVNQYMLLILSILTCLTDWLPAKRCVSFINWYMYIPIRIKFFYSQENSQKFPNKFIAHSYFNIAWHCYVTIRRTCNLMLWCYKLLGTWRIKIYSFIHF